MGLTAGSTGRNAVDNGLVIRREQKDDRVIALAGNPNVGKSTLFNELTGMNQHTGNWPGKTVTNAQGRHQGKERGYILVDLPGTYSLLAHSAEEECARDFICFGGADAAIVVCDATCLERNLNLVFQTMEITPRVVVCVNLLDEAKRKNIHIDLQALSERLGVPVAGTSARSGRGLEELMEYTEQLCSGQLQPSPLQVKYPAAVETAIGMVEPHVRPFTGEKMNARWVSLKLIDEDPALLSAVTAFLETDLGAQPSVAEALQLARAYLVENGIPIELLKDKITSSLIVTAERTVQGVVRVEKSRRQERDRKLDRILTSRWTGIPIMLLLLAGIFWLTIEGANYPSQLLSGALFWVQDRLTEFCFWLGAPAWVNGLFVEGVYRTLAWVVSVMLPPMAIFFPLFTLLEDFGYLPRVAFNLDHPFKKAKTCGKQALTMCSGKFGILPTGCGGYRPHLISPGFVAV